MTSVKNDWFYTRKIGPGIWMIAEPQHVYSYLIEGEDEAALIDTGLNMFPIRPVAEELTDRPLKVINTHYHFDHIGGNHEFDDIAIHEIGAPLIEEANVAETYSGYLEYSDLQIAAGEATRPHDRNFLWILSPESEPRPFPASFDRDAWTIPTSKATSTFKDGDTLDVGGRKLQVIHAPGHAPDAVSLLEEDTGFIFVGDCVGPGPIYAQFEDSSLEDLAVSARKLADVNDKVKIAVFGHYGRPLAEPDFFPEVADGLEQLVSGELELEKGSDYAGNPALERRFDHFSVLVEDPDA